MYTYSEIHELLNAGLISLAESIELMQATDSECYNELDSKSKREIDQRGMSA